MSLPASWDRTKKAIKNGPDRQLDPSTLKHVYADHMWKCGYMVRAYVIDMIWNMYMPVCIQIFFYFCSAELIVTTDLLHKSTMALDLTLQFTSYVDYSDISCVFHHSI